MMCLINQRKRAIYSKTAKCPHILTVSFNQRKFTDFFAKRIFAYLHVLQ